MAKWKVTPGSVNNSMTGEVNYDKHESRWEIKQDVSAVLEEVKRDRELASRHTPTGWRKAFTIPDVVAIELLTKYGMDIHAHDFMHDHMNMAKLKQVIAQDYPYLLIST